MPAVLSRCITCSRCTLPPCTITATCHRQDCPLSRLPHAHGACSTNIWHVARNTTDLKCPPSLGQALAAKISLTAATSHTKHVCAASAASMSTLHAASQLSDHLGWAPATMCPARTCSASSRCTKMDVDHNSHADLGSRLDGLLSLRQSGNCFSPWLCPVIVPLMQKQSFAW